MKTLKVAILVADGFEHSEMVEPKKALEEAGYETVLVSPCKGKVKSWQAKNWGEEFIVDQELTQANPEDFQALLLPGGVISPDTLRMNPQAIEFVKHFAKRHKPIAAICHGPWTLIDAEAIKGKKVTSWSSIKIDLINAGADWVDKEVVIDDYLVTSRKPDDILEFNKAILQLLTQLTNK